MAISSDSKNTAHSVLHMDPWFLSISRRTLRYYHLDRALEVDLPYKEEKNDERDCKKRKHASSTAGAGNKACREKMRRDKLKDRFVELYSILDTGKPHKSDKLAMLSDATSHLNELRLEVQKLKESNGSLRDTIKSLKAEKLELKDEKMRLKTEKDRIEQMLKDISFPQSLIAQPAVATFHPAAFAACNKDFPCSNYPPIGMWHWTPPASLDTSQDHVLRPPVA
ncbi:hypothetical protein Taro_014036 [Colocasia esculenta]|uniref:BHLH domain-containing protein n=1 Tax=Colocasia esculenta TaxID=4460 RepID=A0A843UDD8_COLES|nr:hypothetical protein [Colocasia esculenta]